MSKSARGKAKLGKGKQIASNATNTSFKARSIAIPRQTIFRDPAAAPSDRHTAALRRRHHLTLDGIIAQLRHPNSNKRKDAIAALEGMHRDEAIVQHGSPLGPILSSVIRLVADEDAGVRKAFLRFLRPYLATIDASRARPWMSLVVLHIGSAMSHIFPDIRIDAVKALDICMAKFGPDVVAGWQQQTTIQSSKGGARLLQAYLALLGASTSAATHGRALSVRNASLLSTDMSRSALNTVLCSLRLFLQHALPLNDLAATAICPTWMFGSSLAHGVDRHAFETSLPRVRNAAARMEEEEQNAWLASGTSADASQITAAVASVRQLHTPGTAGLPSMHSKSNGDGGAQLHLFEILSPVLVTVLLDAAPSASMHSAPSAQLIVTTLSLTITLWRGIERASTHQCAALAAFLARLSAHFPMGGNEGEGDEVWTDVNLCYCELVGLLSNVTATDDQGEVVSSSDCDDSIDNLRVDSVAEYVRTVLCSGTMLRGDRLSSLLPTVWLLLRHQAAKTTDQLTMALTRHSTGPASQRTISVFLDYINRLSSYASYDGRVQLDLFPL